MTPPVPAELLRSHRKPAPSRLERWRDAEPVRLYAYAVLAALALVLVAAGWVTGELAHTLTGLAAAVLGVVPAAEAARASVYSPATQRELARAAEARWTAMTYRPAA